MSTSALALSSLPRASLRPRSARDHARKSSLVSGIFIHHAESSMTFSIVSCNLIRHARRAFDVLEVLEGATAVANDALHRRFDVGGESERRLDPVCRLCWFLDWQRVWHSRSAAAKGTGKSQSRRFQSFWRTSAKFEVRSSNSAHMRPMHSPAPPTSEILPVPYGEALAKPMTEFRSLTFRPLSREDVEYFQMVIDNERAHDDHAVAGLGVRFSKILPQPPLRPGARERRRRLGANGARADRLRKSSLLLPAHGPRTPGPA